MDKDVEFLSDFDVVNYDELNNSLVQNINLTTKQNSIIIELRIDNNKCYISSKKIEQDGDVVELQNKFLEFNEALKKRLIESFLYQFVMNNIIIVNEISDSEISNKSNCRIVTDTNDMFVIIGIDHEYAFYLCDLITNLIQSNNLNITHVKKLNARGVSDFVIIVMTIILIGITFIGTVYFTINS